ncbi:uncharacterized protein LOC103942366 [Pyrus x bretschneideri]|uniref:uncharacterized protein LOC103942366 n=1 Tax=Pyrus x bretschneideri TaxID=225117 RepID=UPI00202FE5E3|nr:uncharacterized protein LOC103942366 [Pyrus x bretschneideri]
MEDLRRTAFAYYKYAPTDVQRLVDETFYEMDLDKNDRVSWQEFTKYMEMHGDCKHLCNSLFFDELKKEGHEELDFMDVMSLFYIVYSGKPFCNGQCRKFIKGVYFACVKCFDDDATDATNTFNVCPACYVDGKYVHGHDKFLDNFLLLQRNRMTALNQQAASITNESKAPEYGSTSETSNSSSPAPQAPPAPPRPLTPHTYNAMVPVNPRPKKECREESIEDDRNATGPGKYLCCHSVHHHVKIFDQLYQVQSTWQL